MSTERKYAFVIGYIALLYLMIPLSILSVYFGNTIFDFLGDGILGLISIWIFIYTAAIFILAAINIRRALTCEDAIYSTNCMLVMKYGLIIWYVAMFFSSAVLTVLIAVGDGGLDSSQLAILIATSIFFTALAWLLLVPGGFWGMKSVSLLRKEGKLGRVQFVLLVLSQFMLLFDIFGAMYISAKYGLGKRSRIAVLALMGIFACTAAAALLNLY